MMWVYMALLAACLWGIEYALAERLLVKVSPFVLYFWITVFQLAGCILLSVASPGSLDPRPLLTRDVRGIFLICVVTAMAAGLLINASIKNSGNATASSLIEISYPFFVALASWMLLREVRVSANTGIGGVLIAAGVYFVSKT